MNKYYVVKGLLLFLFISLTLHLQADPPSPFYQGDLGQLKKQARKTNTPYFIYFQLPDCESCNQMEEETWKDSRVSRYVAQNYLGYRVNAVTPAQGQRALEEFGIFVFPALLIFDADGKLQKHVEGYIDAANLMKLFSGEPICTSLESTPAPGTTPVATKPSQPFASRPVYDRKKIDASYHMPTPAPTTPVAAQSTPANANPGNTSARAINMQLAPAKAAPAPANPSNVQNDVYTKYNALHQATLARQQPPQAAQPTHTPVSTVTVRPASISQLKESDRQQPGVADPAPMPTRGVSRGVDKAAAPTPSTLTTSTVRNFTPLRSLPDLTASPATTRTKVAAQPKPKLTPPTDYQAIEDPRFRTYDPWKSLAPIAGINYSLVLDTYATADLALAEIEAIKQYWPNTIWAYQEGKNGAYRLALGNFRSEEQAQQYAELLLRSNQRKSVVSDLITVISKETKKSVTSR